MCIHLCMCKYVFMYMYIYMYLYTCIRVCMRWGMYVWAQGSSAFLLDRSAIDLPLGECAVEQSHARSWPKVGATSTGVEGLASSKTATPCGGWGLCRGSSMGIGESGGWPENSAGVGFTERCPRKSVQPALPTPALGSSSAGVAHIPAPPFCAAARPRLGRPRSRADSAPAVRFPIRVV